MKPVFHPDIDDVAAGRVSLPRWPIRSGSASWSRWPMARRSKARCGSFTELASPSLLSYHFAKLREAGVTRVRGRGHVAL